MVELESKIEFLEKQISLLQGNLNFNLSLTWAILGVIVAVLALSSFFSIKSWFNKRFEAETKKIDERIHKFMKENPQLQWAKGNASILQWTQKESGYYESIHLITGLTNFKKENLIYIDAFYVQGEEKRSLNNTHILLSDDGITLTVREKNPIPHNLNVSYFILWTNPIYQDLER